MYTFSNKLKMASIILMIVGILGIGYGFISSPSTVEEAKAMVAADAHHGGAASHGEESHEATTTHHSEASEDAHHEASASHGDEAAEHASHDAHTLSKLQNRPWAAF